MFLSTSKTKGQEDANEQTAESQISKPAKSPTNQPFWNEFLSIDYPENRAKFESMFAIYGISKLILTLFQFNLVLLESFDIFGKPFNKIKPFILIQYD